MIRSSHAYFYNHEEGRNGKSVKKTKKENEYQEIGDLSRMFFDFH